MEVIHNLDISGRLKIYQDTKLNSYTFDSLLLANFTNLKKKDNLIVDLCSGNSPVGMLLTLKKDDIEVRAVEIQEEVHQLAVKSLKVNNLENKIKCYNENLKGINKKIGANKYDIITCNPPYFRIDDTSNLNENNKVAIARHEITITLEEIIIESKILLNNMGSLNFVYRPDRLDELTILLDKYNFEIKRIQFVYPKLNKDCNTILVEAKKGKSKNNKMKILEPLIIYTQNSEYTDDAKKIMNMEK